MAINITISNYEEYLLSAVDGELNAEEQAALEAFLQQHPHIRQELSLLEATRLAPDEDLKFEGKGQLYRSDEGITPVNYELLMLQYVDNELHGPEKEHLEQLAARHPQIKQELALLQKARLTPDLSVTFGDKSSLYKRESRKVRPLWWWSAAAAVVVGLGVWLLPGAVQQKGGQMAVQQPASGTGKGTEGSLAHENQGHSVSEGNRAPAGEAPLNGNITGNDQSSADLIASATETKAPANRTPATEKNKPAQRTTVTTAGVNTAGNVPAESEKHRIPDNTAPVIARIPQPENTSREVVRQLEERRIQEDVAIAGNNLEVKPPVMANSEKMVNTPAAAAAPAAQSDVKGELVVSVTMNGDSKLLNGVANVARFFSRKKK